MHPTKFDQMMLGRWAPTGLCSIENEDDDAAGGEPKPFKPDAGLTKHIFDTANAALTKRLKSKEFAQQLGDVLKPSITELLTTSIGSLKEELGKANEAAGEAGTAPRGTNQHTASNRPDPEKEQLKARLKEQDDRLKRMEDDRAAEVATAKSNEERAIASEALRKAGVPEPRIRTAMALITAEMKAIGRDGDGRVVWRSHREGYVDELPLADGVKEFLATEEGKAFLPPVGGGGSGSRGGRSPGAARTTSTGSASAGGPQAGANNGTGKMDKGQAVEVLMATLLNGGPGGEIPGGQ